MPICASFSSLSRPLKWRNVVTHNTLAAQLSSFLLHNKKAFFFLRSKLSLFPRPLPSSLLRSILSRTRSQPDVSLRFFVFAYAHLSFSPNLSDLSVITSILVAAGHFSPIVKLISPALLSYPTPAVLNSLLRSSSFLNVSQSEVLSFALQLYCMFPSTYALETLKRMKSSRLIPSSRSFNTIISFLSSTEDFLTSWSVCAAALRLGTKLDDGSWVILVSLLLQEDKVHRAEMLLSSGFGERSSNYDMLVTYYASRKEFTAAVRVLNTMGERGFRPRLSTLSSILEESCRLGDFKMAGIIIKEMVVKDLLPMDPGFDFDWIIKAFCDLGKTFCAMLIFMKAQRQNHGLVRISFVSMLQALAQNGQASQAMKVFDMMSHRGFCLDLKSFHLFSSGICSGEPTEDVDSVIMDFITNGPPLPKASSLSHYITKNCYKGRWKEAAELLYLALDKGLLINVSCCCFLMMHFCDNGFLDLAIDLHERVVGFAGCLNSDSYNTLLEALVKDGRVAEAVKVFDYMRKKDVVSSLSFVIMITVLCHEKELRKAMDFHEEMLLLKLKPDTATYKRLISGFE